MQVRVRENNIKELKVHILNRDIDKIIETLADEQAIDAYAQAIKARDLLYNTKQKEEITALIESYCACESNVEPWQMMAKMAFMYLWGGVMLFVINAFPGLSISEVARNTNLYKGFVTVLVSAIVTYKIKNPVKRENDAKMRLLTLKDKLGR